jgi:hypothetical protein
MAGLSLLVMAAVHAILFPVFWGQMQWLLHRLNIFTNALSSRDDSPTRGISSFIGPQAIEPGTAMSDLGVSESEAGNIADYLYHKLTINDFISQ